MALKIIPSTILNGAGFLFTAALLAGAPQTGHADASTQRQDLSTALRQLDALERVVVHSSASANAQLGTRHHFDYPRLLDDLARVRAGIRDYLSPPRAQPRDPTELLGDYRQPVPAPPESESAP